MYGSQELQNYLKKSLPGFYIGPSSRIFWVFDLWSCNSQDVQGLFTFGIILRVARNVSFHDLSEELYVSLLPAKYWILF